VLPSRIQKPRGDREEKLFLFLFLLMYVINYYFCWALEFGEIRCNKIWAQMIFLQVSAIASTQDPWLSETIDSFPEKQLKKHAASL
jgi:hypothetical protein